MKVLHINCVYPGGSTGKITAAIHEKLKSQGHSSLVLYGRGKGPVPPEAIKTGTDFAGKANHALARISGMAYGGCGWQTARILSIIDREKPDVVHLQCINGYFVNIYRLVAGLKRRGIPTVLTLHAEFMYTANCGCSFGCDQWKTGCRNCPDPKAATETLFFNRTAESFQRMRQAFRGFQELCVVGVSQWLCGQAAQSPILGDKEIVNIKNGIDISVFHPRSGEAIRRELGIAQGEKMVLWVTSGFTHAKGRDYFARVAKALEGQPYRLVVVGAERPREETGNVAYMGMISDQQRLAEIYAGADVTLCCSRQESYPTTLLESQCCGTPVVGFRVGGVEETLIPGMGQTVPMGDVDGMIAALKLWSDGKQKICRQVQQTCLVTHGAEAMTDAYLKLYGDLWSRCNGAKKTQPEF